jgi:hypothetical protein
MSHASEKDVIRAAWLEWIVARQTGSGSGMYYLPLFIEMPGWFLSYELGLALPEGPSIFWTAQHLEQINRAHRSILAGRDLQRSRRKKGEQAVANQRRREWGAMLRLKPPKRR